MPTPNSNPLAIQLLNALGSSVDETAKSILAEFKPPFKPQNNQIFTNAKDQFDLYTWT